ncbi:MAG: hypothetical protein H6822_01600 [Planctomycetaceae bacterium]|nr:hypothetical protein [Planctomycetales bacterium]MCB9920842.1 hypothetical protein [Planctomycetaceae bacterium]
MTNDPSEGNLPQRRVVLLGASNIARGLSIVVDSARNAWGGPLDIIAATGHGRSYGMSSRVFGRTLPGILQSGLWEAVAVRSPMPTAALLTDIGNDILYGASAEQITRWVERCLIQLTQHSQRIIITQLPLASIEQLCEFRFLAMRTILFPKSRLTLNHALATARELSINLTELARRHHAQLVEPAAQWYGIDPIHIRRTHQPEAWKQILQPWNPHQDAEHARHSWVRWVSLRRIRPQTRHMFGREQHHEQPARRLPDGSLVSLY